jgi:bis(5'-adenosyl)-triphosphatase
MPPLTSKAIHFGSFLVTPQVRHRSPLALHILTTLTYGHQVFHVTSHSFALVNLKPILPGHILICPLRRHPRFSDLSPAEVSDLFLTVQRVSRMLERVYKASALNIAIQDGEDAGQSVPHVHVHVLPRRAKDLDDRGGPDAVYGLMDGEEGDVGGHLRQRDRRKESEALKVDADDQRKPRTEEEMRREAEWLADEMKSQDEIQASRGNLENASQPVDTI